jgi:hypothetical protein
MSHGRGFFVALAGLVLMQAQSALAVGASSARQQAARQPSQASAVQPPDESNSLRQGVVTALGTKGDQVEIQGRWHSIVPGRTHFFRLGQPVAADMLKKGQVLKFTLVAGSVNRNALGIVYVP